MFMGREKFLQALLCCSLLPTLSFSFTACRSEGQRQPAFVSDAELQNDASSLLQPKTQLVRQSLRLDWSLPTDELIESIERVNLQTTINIPDALKKRASGLSNRAWQFTDSDLNQKFNLLFQKIAASSQWGFEIDLDRNDLFHGHLLTISYEQQTDIAILFHSKEYPNDPDIVAQNMGLGRQNSYSTSSLGYTHRNFLWLNKARLIINFDGTYIADKLEKLFLPPEAQSLPQDLKNLFLKTKTLQTERLPGFQKKLGDVNLLSDPSSKQIFLFFTHNRSSLVGLSDPKH